jgi:hypothetical protein
MQEKKKKKKNRPGDGHKPEGEDDKMKRETATKKRQCK